MIQPGLFDVRPKPKRREPNTTEAGELACAFGTLWLAHFAPPIGTGAGCVHCDRVGA